MRAIDELPWDSGWAVGSRTAVLLLELLNEKKPKLILDIGSGLTTILFGEWAKYNKAKVISLEHEQKYFDNTKELLDKYGFTVDLRLAKLVVTEHGYFYDTELPNNIDFVLIDGPPGSIGRQATLYSVYPNLSKGFTAILDDYNRAAEKQMVKEWSDRLNIKVIKHGRLAEIRPKDGKVKP